MYFIFFVKKGEKIVIIGESGVGKSMLFNLIVGFELFISGEIWLDNCNYIYIEVFYCFVFMLF